MNSNKTNFKLQSIFSFAFLLFALSLSSQTTLTLQASADAMIVKNAAVTNYGAQNYMQVYPWGADYSRRFLVEFDLSAIPSGAIITQADLKLFETATYGSSRTINAHVVNSAWTETTVNWSNINSSFQSVVSASFQPSFPSNVNGIWNVKNDVQAMVNNTVVNNGWMFKDQTEDASQQYWQFATKEFSNVALRPQLIITYTVNATPVLNVSGPVSICSGQSTTLTASGMNSYSWEPATGLNTTTGTTVVANPTTTTTYTVTGTSAAGVTSTKTVTVTVNSNPTITVTPSAPSITAGQSVQLTASGANTYLWLPSVGLSASTGATVTANPSATIIYTVNGTDHNNCIASKSVTITVQETSTPCDFTRLNAEVVNSCEGDSTGSILITGLDNVFTGKMSLYDCNDGTLISGNNIVVNAGEIKRIGTTANANITINGGVLVTCGSVTVSSINILGGGMLSINGGLAFNCNVDIPENGVIVNNYGSVAFYQPVSVNGTLLNLDGSMATYSTLISGANGAIVNNSQFTNVLDGTSMPNNFSDSASRTATVIWNGITEGNYLTKLAQGTYTATITAGTCSTTKTYVVGLAAKPQISAVSVSNTNAENCNGSLSGSVSGGVEPYYYRWFDNNQHNFSFTSNADSLCGGTYSFSVIDNLGCSAQGIYTVVNNINNSVDTINNGNNNGVDTTSSGGNGNNNVSYTNPDENAHTHVVAVDSAALLMKQTGLNNTWNLSGIDFSKYQYEQKTDTVVHHDLSPSAIMKTYHPFYGEVISNQFSPKTYNQFSMDITRLGNYTITQDGTGTLQIGNVQYTNTKRIHVREEIKNFCSSCGEVVDSLSLYIDSYYWFASDTATIPLLTYRETDKYWGRIYIAHYQEIVQSSINTAFNMDAFRRMVNLTVTPNPAYGSNVTISYTLAENAATVLSFDNSVTGLHHIIQSTNQNAGNYSVNYNMDAYLSGSYTVTLNIGGIIVSQNLIINH